MTKRDTLCVTSWKLPEGEEATGSINLRGADDPDWTCTTQTQVLPESTPTLKKDTCEQTSVEYLSSNSRGPMSIWSGAVMSVCPVENRLLRNASQE